MVMSEDGILVMAFLLIGSAATASQHGHRAYFRPLVQTPQAVTCGVNCGASPASGCINGTPYPGNTYTYLAPNRHPAERMPGYTRLLTQPGARPPIHLTDTLAFNRACSRDHHHL